jgi:Protein of unknown function (DUF2380)
MVSVIPFATLAAWLFVGTAASADERSRLAVFDFELINTSLEPDRPDERQRLAMLDKLLRERVAASGRFRLVNTAPLRERIARGPELRNCNGCDLDLGREVGADIVATGTVQKVSNLILNINLVLKDVATGAAVAGGSIDIRGNTDESWQRGLERLLRNQGLAPAGPASGSTGRPGSSP